MPHQAAVYSASPLTTSADRSFSNSASREELYVEADDDDEASMVVYGQDTHSLTHFELLI